MYINFRQHLNSHLRHTFFSKDNFVVFVAARNTLMKFVYVLAVLAFQAGYAFQVAEDLDGFFDGANDADLQQVEGQTRIVGGNTASRTRYTYFTRVDEYSRQHCGGVLVHSDIVLTAAHCASNYLSAVVNAYVTSGSYSGQINRSVQQVIVHPNYNSKTRSNDFAILKLSSPVYTVYPIALNGDGAGPAIGQSLTVIGVGAIRENGPSSGVLQQASVNVLNPDTCNSNRQYNGMVIASTMFCAGTQSGERDSCQGDSGGPLIQVINGIDTLVGIVSWGEGCARSSYPGVYARVSWAKSWIDSTICSITSVAKAGCPGVSLPRAPVPAPVIQTFPFAAPVVRPTPFPTLVPPLVLPTSYPTGIPPSPYPTVSLPTPFPTSAPVILPTNHPTDIPPASYPTGVTVSSATLETCADDEFLTYYVPFVGYQRCDWLRARPAFQNALCKPANKAYDICKETCKNCLDNCKDSREDVLVNGINRNCSFISLRPRLRERQCQPGFPAYTKCQVTCNACARKSPITLRPTSPPVVRGNAATASKMIPTLSPQLSSSCDDSLFDTFYVASLRQDQRCVWLRARPEYISKLCVEGHTSRARQICPETCGACTDSCEDSETKFNIDGKRRDCLWLSLRVAEQFKNCKPEHAAWFHCRETCENCSDRKSAGSFEAAKLATVNHDVVRYGRDSCDDSNFGSFYVSSKIGQQKCEWLRARPGWQDILCAEGHASSARMVCPETCNVCRDACEDSTATFMIDDKRRDCLWLSLRPDKQDEVCNDKNHEAYTACPETCNSCSSI